MSRISLSKNFSIKQTELCHDGFFKLKRHTIQYDKFDGTVCKPHRREVLVREPTVAVLLYDGKQDSILLTEQFRVGPLENGDNPWMFEVPAGIVEQGEDKRQAIEREILEETGYSCEVGELIGEFYLSPGGTNEVTSLYFAKLSLTSSGMHGAMGENEDIKTHILSVDKAYILMQKGNLSVITGLALLWLLNNKRGL